MITILAQVLRVLGMVLPWLLKVAPWLLTILNVLFAFWPAAQQWVAGLASTALEAAFSVTPMTMADLPTYYLTQINTFIPLDLIVTTFALYLPFYLSCLAQRIARSTIFGKR